MSEVRIDREQFDWAQPTITGDQLRQLPSPPIGGDRDIYEELTAGEDKLIEIGAVVQLKEHGETRFFTAPHHVTPGA